jgi:hypothetical protein
VADGVPDDDVLVQIAEDPPPHLLDLLEALLTFCAHHGQAFNWPELRVANSTEIDLIRARATDPSPVLCTPVDTGADALQFLIALFNGFDHLHPLVRAATAARVIDDLWAPMLISAWPSHRLDRGGFVGRGDVVMVPGEAHLTGLFPGHSLAASATRAAERPDQTARALLFDPGELAPPVHVSVELDAHLDDVMDGALAAAACAPDRQFLDLRAEFPVRPLDSPGHVDACRVLVERAIEHGAAIVVLPEFAGYAEVTDALRQIRPPRPVLVVAGSGHAREGGRQLNRSLFWVARASGPVPAAKPLSILKRVPYEGALGAEPLTELADRITVYVAGPWRLAIGICRDLLDDLTVVALRQLGVNLLIVPACTAKTSNLAANTSVVASNVPGLAIVANGPRRFPARPAAADDGEPDDVDVPTGIFTAPVDRIEPRLMAGCEPPGLVLFRFAEHDFVIL